MINRQNVVSELRRDASIVGGAMGAVVFVAFVGLALAATLYDIVY
jgi:hypothetical protein